MWPPEELASRLYDLANWGLVVGLVVGVVSTVLIVWMGNVKEAYLRKDVAHAEDSAAQANERASANEREAARLRELAESERLARVELQETLAWRRLTKEQQDAMGIALRPFAGEVALMLYGMGDREAEIFSLDIWTALNSAEWKVTAPGGILSSREVGLLKKPPGIGEAGVLLTPTTDAASQQAATALAREFRRLGFDSSIEKPDTNAASGHRVQVDVSTRPLGPQGAAKLRAEAQHNAR